MEPEVSLQRLQQPTICPYPEPNNFIPCLSIPLPECTSSYYPAVYAWVLKVVTFPQVSPPKTLSGPLLSSIRATCSSHLILIDFINRTIFGEEYSSWSSSLCSFLHLPVTSSHLDPNIILSILFSYTLSLTFLPQCERPCFTPIKNYR